MPDVTPEAEPVRLLGYITADHAWPGGTGEVLVTVWTDGTAEVAIRPDGYRRWLPPVELTP